MRLILNHIRIPKNINESFDGSIFWGKIPKNYDYKNN